MVRASSNFKVVPDVGNGHSQATPGSKIKQIGQALCRYVFPIAPKHVNTRGAYFGAAVKASGNNLQEVMLHRNAATQTGRRTTRSRCADYIQAHGPRRRIHRSGRIDKVSKSRISNISPSLSGRGARQPRNGVPLNGSECSRHRGATDEARSIGSTESQQREFEIRSDGASQVSPRESNIEPCQSHFQNIRDASRDPRRRLRPSSEGGVGSDFDQSRIRSTDENGRDSGRRTQQSRRMPGRGSPQVIRKRSDSTASISGSRRLVSAPSQEFMNSDQLILRH